MRSGRVSSTEIQSAASGAAWQTALMRKRQTVFTIPWWILQSMRLTNPMRQPMRSSVCRPRGWSFTIRWNLWQHLWRPWLTIRQKPRSICCIVRNSVFPCSRRISMWDRENSRQREMPCAMVCMPLNPWDVRWLTASSGNAKKVVHTAPCRISLNVRCSGTSTNVRSRIWSRQVPVTGLTVTGIRCPLSIRPL